MLTGHDLRVFLPALITWGATVALVFQPQHALWLACCAALLALAFTALAVYLATARGVMAILAIALALFAAISARVATEQVLRGDEYLVGAASHGAEHIWWGSVTAVDPQLRVQLTAFSASESDSPESTQVHQTSLAAVVQTNAELPAEVVIGAQVSFTGSASLFPAGRTDAVLIRAEEIRVAKANAALVAAESIRDRLRETARALPGDGAQLVPGLAVGDTQLLSDQLKERMNAASLSHLTAVSGANIAIIVGLAFFVGSKLRLRRVLRVALAVLATISFVILVTPEPSVLRAAVMAGVTLVVLATSRTGSGVAALGVAVVVLLLLNPWQATEFGFVLSVLATGGILLLTAPITKKLSRWMPRWLSTVIAVPLAAQLACQPAILLLQADIPLLGVLANTLAAPAAPLATISGLAACLTLPVAPLIGQLLLWLSWLPASWIAVLANAVAATTFTSLPWPEGAGGAVLLTLASLGLVVSGLAAARFRQSPLRWSAAAVSFGIVLVVVIIDPSLHRLTHPRDWSLYACDVGQGDAVMLQSQGEIALIDTGEEPELVEECLDEQGIRAIDVLVLSHDDRDHVGGLTGIVSRVRRALIAPPIDDEPREVEKILANARVPTQHAYMGTSLKLGDLALEVLWPRAHHTESTTNDGSVIIYAHNSAFSALFLGDLGEQSQRRLLQLHAHLRADVVKVSHHGSADQLEALYRQVAASIGIVSVGDGNGYGHPTAEALALLDRVGTRVLRTDLGGALALWPVEQTDGADTEGRGRATTTPIAPVRWRIWAEHSAPQVG